MQKKLNMNYSASQFFYFSMFASMFAFASVFLLDKGFDNATIGTVLSITSLAAIGVQTLLANYVDKYKQVRIQDVLSVVAIVIIAASILLFFVPYPFFILLLVVVAFSFAQSAPTLLNSLAFIYNRFGIKINYGIARGMGSLAYAVSTMVLGYIVDATSPEFLPLFYITFALLLLVSIRSYHLPEEQQVVAGNAEEVKIPLEEQVAVEQTLFEFMKEYKKLVLLMGGIVFLFFAHTMINNFFIQIITPIGGDSGAMGTAIFIGAIVELPAMMNFNRLASKISVDRLLKISAVFFLAKHALTFLAPNVLTIYAAQFLQIGAFSIVYPALVEYINSIVSVEDLVKGQSLLTSAMALSSVFASFIGGILLDSIGVSQTLWIGVITTVIGLVIVFLTVEDTSKASVETISS